MTNEQAKEARDYAWRYFDLHAKQRMSVFNFFLVLAGLLAASYVNSFTGAPPNHALSTILATMLSLISLIFWRLDRRTAYLIKNAEAALAHAEEVLSGPDSEPTVDQLIRFEAKRTRELTRSWFSTHMTYSTCFRSVFFIFGFGGVVGVAVSITIYFGCYPL